MNEFKQSIDEKKSEVEKINKDIEEKGDKGQAKVQKEIEESKVNLATQKTRKDNLRSELDKITLRRKQLDKDIDEVINRVEELEKQKKELSESKTYFVSEIRKIDTKISKFRDDNAINNASEIEKQVDDLDKQAEEKQKLMEGLRVKQQELIRSKDSLEYKFNSVDEQITKISSLEKEYASQLAELKTKKARFKESITELNKRLEEDTMLARQIGEKKSKLVVREEEFAKYRARQVQVRESSRGNIAVKNLLDSNKRGVYGTVRDLGSVSGSYSNALEAAAGPRINSLVVEDDKVAAECIKYLKDKKLGFATFLPLNKIKSREPSAGVSALTTKKGVEGFAIDLVTFDQKYQKAFSYIFGDTLVVKDVDVARSVGIGNARMVTLTGDLTETSGAMHGGHRNKKGVGFSESEVLKGLKSAEDDINELSGSLSVLINRREENEQIIDNLRKEKADLEGDIIKDERSLHLESGELDSSQKKKEDLAKEIDQAGTKLIEVEDELSEFTKEVMIIKTKRQEFKESLNKVRNPAVLAELNAFSEKKDEFKEKLLETDSKIKSAISELNDMRLPEKEKLNELVKGLGRDEEKFKGESEKLSNEIKLGEKSLIEKEEKARQFYAQYKGLFVQRSKIEDTIGSDEKKVDDLREKAKDVEIKVNQISLVAAEIKARLAGLKEEFSQYEGVAINENKSLEDLKKDMSSSELMIIMNP